MVPPIVSGDRRALRIALMLESDGPGGAEVVVQHLAEELRERGHTVVPVGPRNGVGWLGECLRAAGFTPETFRIARAIDPDCARSLVEIFRKHRVDVVHSHEFTMAVYGALAARVLRIPHVVSLHGSQTMCRRLRRRIAIRWAIRNSRATVAVSQSTRDALSRALAIDASGLTVIPNGVPVRTGDPVRVRAELGIAPEDLVVLAVGNLDERKGHMLLLRALQQLDDEGLGVPWRLVIAGGRGGPQQEPLERFAAEHGLAGRVHILTRRDDIPDLQAAAQVFAMPSLWEGLPMAMLEAMIAGNAVVASRTGGIPEAIVDGEQGLLVAPGDVPALKQALRTVLVDREYRERLARAAKARGLTEFTLPVMGDAYERLYRSAVDVGQHQRPRVQTLATAAG